MFSKKHRFSFKNKLPKNVINSPSFTIRYDKNGGELKVAVVVSKKVDNRATVRNKIKRIILETVRKEINTDANLNIVFYAKKSAVESSELGEELRGVLRKVV